MADGRSYRSLLNGEWDSYFKHPKALDTDSPEVLETAAAVTKFGFDHFILIQRFVLPAAGPIQIVLSNWRTDWYQRYWAKGYLYVDPVVARMVRSSHPFDWHEIGALTHAQADFFADAVRHGLVDGFAGAARFGSDQAGFFSVSSESPRSSEVKEQAMARVFLHAARLYERMRQEMLAHNHACSVILTARQREVLQLTLRGVSRRAASRIMRCSESNFVRHQEAARRKLGEKTNLDAVRKAVAMNLIRPYDMVIEHAPSACASKARR